MKKLISIILSTLFFVFECMGWFFMYGLVYVFTTGATIGNVEALIMLIASIASTFGLFLAVLEWGA